MKKLKVLQIVAVLLLLSCQHQPSEVIDKSMISVAKAVGTGEILNLSDYAKSIEYILLETNDSLLIGDIVYFTREKGKILLGDFQNYMCMMFSEDGRFVRRIGTKGEGPEEYIVMRSVYLLPKDSLFFLDGYPRRYYLYDLDGNFVKQVAYPDYPETYRPWRTVALGADLLFSDLTSPEHVYYRGMFFGEKVSDKSKMFMNFMDREKEKKGSWGGSEGAFIWNYKDTVRYFRSLNDTVYSITPDMNIKKRYTFDLGIYNPPASAQLNHEQDEKYIRFYREAIMESSNYLFLNFHFGQHAPEAFEKTYRNIRGKVVTQTIKNVYGLFNKSTGRFTLLNQPIKKQLGFYNDIDGGPTFWPQYISADEKMVAYWNAEEFLKLYEQLPNPSLELKKVAEKLSPDDNPVLMVVTLK